MEALNDWLGAVNWHPHTLHRRESIASLIAKFSISNHIRPSHFAAMVAKMRLGGDGYGSASSRRRWTIRAGGPEVRRLARLLGEPTEVVGSGTLNDMPTPCFWIAWKLGLHGPSMRARGFCERCLQEGYHSVFHQVPWLRRCFIHGSRLTEATDRQMPPRGRLSTLEKDSGLANFLYECWMPRTKRDAWWGVNVNGQPFDKSIARAESELVRRWLGLCGINALYGDFSRGDLTIAEAELLAGIRKDVAPDELSSWPANPWHYERFIPLPDIELKSILENREQFERQLDTCRQLAQLRLANKNAALSKTLVDIRSAIKAKLSEGHLCGDLADHVDDLVALYGWRPCRGARRLGAWSSGRFCLIEDHYWPLKIDYNWSLEPITGVLMEIYEWALGHAALNDLNEGSALTDYLAAAVRPHPWFPALSFEVVENGLKLRLLCPAPLHLPSQTGDLTTITECCKASLADLEAKKTDGVVGRGWLGRYRPGLREAARILSG